MLQVGNLNSETLPVPCSVPQRSIMGPLLFILYINDMSFSKPSMNLDLYADDCIHWHKLERSYKIT